MTRLAITLLGPFAVSLDGQPVTAFESDHVRALLAYLAVTPGRAHDRASLADLLWPTRPEDAARANLRHALSRLRHTLADHDPARPLIRAGHGSVALAPAPDVGCDAARFAALADACAAHDHAHIESCPLCLARLREAAGLYAGPLLAGPPLARNPIFEEWLHSTREGMERRAATVFATLARAADLADDGRQLCAFARRLLAIEPWSELAHRQLMRGLALCGDRSAALAQYDLCRALLARELGVEPDAETRALCQRIRADDLATATRGAAAPPHALPAPLTLLVGRAAELAELRAWRDVRLLTLVGAGGIGKTRLALALAHEALAAYADGVFFVPLAPLDSPDAIPATIAAALGLSPCGDQPAALLRSLRHKQLLLVLDNFEHLLAGAALVTAILEGAPGARMIVTSRERLNIRGEQLYTVEGLGYTVGPAADVLSVPALQLFVQSARRIMPEFTLGAANAGDVLRICQLVQGMPLGLELAAARADSMTPAQIAAAIERSVHFLAADWRDAPERHRSMASAFEWSWRLLSAEDRRALCRLAASHDGWTGDAAEALAHVARPALGRLVLKSLLRLDERQGAAGRYAMLEPLRRLALELTPDRCVAPPKP